MKRNRKVNKNPILYLIVLLLLGCGSKKNQNNPTEPETWIFLMAGQSNMAGRGLIESQDTITNPRILTINSIGKTILAKEPLHFYEPNLAGLDCGLNFGKVLIKHLPKNITILMIPTAVGGSSIKQWINNENHRGVKLLDNFIKKVNIGNNIGTIKGIIWHQGESDANSNGIENYHENLIKLFSKFREIVNKPNLPILVGELGSFSINNDNWQSINEIINSYSEIDNNCKVISTTDLKDKGDKVHFNSEGQRIMGERFAYEILNIYN